MKADISLVYKSLAAYILMMGEQHHTTYLINSLKVQ